MPLVSKRFGVPRVGQVQFVTSSDVARLKKAIIEQVTALDVAARACQAKLDEPTAAAWRASRNAALQYAGESNPILATASAMNAGQAIQRDLAAWQTKFAALGCTDAPPPEAPEKPKSLLDSLGLDKLETVALVVGAIIVFRELRR